jgi:hypothetical protein
MDSKVLQYLLVIRIAQICYYRVQMVPLYVVELTTGYETNLKNNVKRKKDKYRELMRQLQSWPNVCGTQAN